MPPSIESSTATAIGLGRAGTTLPATASSPIPPARRSSRRAPGWRRRVVTGTNQGSAVTGPSRGSPAPAAAAGAQEKQTPPDPASQDRSWSKKASSPPRVSSSIDSGDARCRARPSTGRGVIGQPLPAGRHGLDGAVQDHLEGGQLLVAVVLRLQPQPAGLVARRSSTMPPGRGLGLADDLGPLHHALGLEPGRLQDVVALALHLGQELVRAP